MRELEGGSRCEHSEPMCKACLAIWAPADRARVTTPHGAAWMRHTEAYLQDRDLIRVFRLAMKRAGFPTVSAAWALEAICADFLAGTGRPPLRSIVEVAGELVCEDHPDVEWPHDGCGGAGMPKKIREENPNA